MESRAHLLTPFFSTIRRPRYAALGLLVVFLAVLPLFLPPYPIRVALTILLYVYFAQSWNIAGGFCGSFSFLHPVFIGAGAFTSTLLFIHLGITPWIGMVGGGLVAVAIGVPVSYVAIRAKLPKLSFSLVTLAVVYIALYTADSMPFLGGHDQGLIVPPKFSVANFLFNSNSTYYYVALVMVIIVMIIAWAILRSTLGMRFRAIADNERAAEAVGVDLMKYNLIAISISAFLCALGGTFYVQYVGSVLPSSAISLDIIISVILFLAVGGMGTYWGPVVGVALLMPMGELLRTKLPQFHGLHLLIYGVVVVVVLCLAPQGIMGLFKKKRNTKNLEAQD